MLKSMPAQWRVKRFIEHWVEYRDLMLDESDLDLVDTATLTPSHPVGHVWRDRLSIGQIAFVADPARDRRILDGCIAASDMHDGARQIAKTIHLNVTGRR